MTALREVNVGYEEIMLTTAMFRAAAAHLQEELDLPEDSSKIGVLLYCALVMLSIENHISPDDMVVQLKSCYAHMVIMLNQIEKGSVN